jgi:hypothetical protein
VKKWRHSSTHTYTHLHAKCRWNIPGPFAPTNRGPGTEDRIELIVIVDTVKKRKDSVHARNQTPVFWPRHYTDQAIDTME